MYFKAILFLMIGAVSSADKKKKVKVDVYFEPLCPVSRDVIANQIAPEVEKLKGSGKLNF
jgi:protein-disulfide isomerase